MKKGAGSQIRPRQTLFRTELESRCVDERDHVVLRQ